MPAELQRAMTDLLTGPWFDPKDPQQVSAWLDRNGVDGADREEILAQGLGHLTIYRDLVRGTLWSAIELAIPRTVARLDDLFEETFDRFMEQRGPETHYLRDVTMELLDWAAPRWASDSRIPPYSLELARHEALRIEIGAMPSRPRGHEAGALELDRGVRFIDAIRLVQYEYRIHELPESDDDRSAPEQSKTRLLVYRSPEHIVRYLELTALAFKILTRLVDREPLGAAITQACEDNGTPLTDSVTQGVAEVLADLAERGALLGASSSDNNHSLG